MDDFGGGDDSPARPGRVDFSDTFEVAIVEIPFRGEVLPHEEIDYWRGVCYAGAEVGECLQGGD